MVATIRCSRRGAAAGLGPIPGKSQEHKAPRNILQPFRISGPLITATEMSISRIAQNRSHCDIIISVTSESMPEKQSSRKATRQTEAVNADLARFRYELRRFLRFSENAARCCGVTPQQHQLMLGVAGFTGRGDATASELAEFLQSRVHSIVGLIDRAERSGLVCTRKNGADRRVVIVTLTRRGETILSKLSAMHHEQAKRLRALPHSLFTAPEVPERVSKARRRAGTRPISTT